jgi:hypothetical protein
MPYPRRAFDENQTTPITYQIQTTKLSSHFSFSCKNAFNFFESVKIRCWLEFEARVFLKACFGSLLLGTRGRASSGFGVRGRERP